MKKEIIIKPLISEKTLKLVEEQNKYTFIVAKKASKSEVKKAVEDRFKVKVIDVTTVNVKGKRVLFGRKRLPGFKKDIRKAVCSLKSSDTLGLFKIK